MSGALTRGLSPRGFGLVAGESLLIVAAIGLAAYARFGDWFWEVISSDYGVLKALLIAVVCQLCLYYADLYDVKQISDRRELLVRLFQALGAASFVLAAIYFWFPSAIIGRGLFLISAGLVISLVIGWRIVFEWYTRTVGPRERLLLVGTGAASVALAREIHDRKQQFGAEIVGFVDPDRAKVGEPVINPGVIGTIEDIPSIVKAKSVDRVVVSLADARGTLPMEKLLAMKLDDGVSFDHLASVYEEYTGKIAVENLRPSWVIFSSGFRKSKAAGALKRGIDLALATVGILVASPLMAAVSLAVRVSSTGPILYHQQRVGHRGRPFTVHKFRTMVVDAEGGTGPVWASAEDPRVTIVGRFLRRTRLDELPQLWNVVMGEMSFVGPRPERPEFVKELTREIPFYGERHVVRPGLTGWAQVCYTYGASKEDALEKLQYDLFYIKNLSMALDAFIILKTFKTVILRRGA